MINTKAQFIELYFRGALGNRLRTWKNYGDLLASGYKGNVTVRSRIPDVSHGCIYQVPVDSIPAIFPKLRDSGSLDLYYFNESAPDEHLAIQGELWNRSLTWSAKKLPMREALQKPSYAEGSTTEMLLRQHMNDNSYEDFMLLRNLYPDHVIEFGCYYKCLGDIPHRNVIIWEVRDY